MLKKSLKYIPYIVLGLLLGCVVLYIYKYNVVFVDSDASSGLVLANHLRQTGQLLSKDWFYATELKFINNNLIFTPLFYLTNNWAVIRAVGNGICLLLLILSALFLYNQIGVKNKAILACFLLLPFSIQYFGMYIGQPAYAFSSIKTFLTIGLLLKYLKSDHNIKLLIILLCALSLIQGLEGMRNIVLTIAPIVCLYFIFELLNYKKILNDDYHKYLIKIRKVIPFMALFTVIGYLIYRFYLLNTYSFMSYEGMEFISFNNETLSSLIGSWLNAFGYVDGKVVSSVLLHNVLSIILLIMTIVVLVSNIKRKDTICKEQFIFTVIVSVAVFILVFISMFVHFINSNMERYYLPTILLIIPLIFVYFENKVNKDNLSKIMFICFITLFCVCGIDNLATYRNNDKREALARINIARTNSDSVELKEIVDGLVKDGYYNGYGYFWNGNVITELSNGQIDMWVWGNGAQNTSELIDINEIYELAQLKKHKTEHPTGKVFLIFTQEELDYSKITDRLDWNKVIYNSKNYTLYGYDSYNKLVEDFNN